MGASRTPWLVSSQFVRRVARRVPSEWAIGAVLPSSGGGSRISEPLLRPGLGQGTDLSLIADPFFLVVDGAVVIYFEGIRRDRDRGEIFALLLDSDGNLELHGSVLSPPEHLSFPFVFREPSTNCVAVMPECSEAGEIRLYLSDGPFGPWSLEVLASGRPFVDNVLLRLNDLWVIVSETSGGTHDRRAILAADSVLGPYELVGEFDGDPSVTRMAGRMVDGVSGAGGDVQLLSQDCSVTYGSSVSLQRYPSSAGLSSLLGPAAEVSLLYSAVQGRWFNRRSHSADLRRTASGIVGVIDGRGVPSAVRKIASVGDRRLLHTLATSVCISEIPTF